MTTTQPGPPDKTGPPPGFRDHLPAIAAAAVAAPVATVLGSFLGAAGTLLGAALGSAVSGTLAWWTERAVRRSTAIAKARADAIRHHGGQPLTAEQTAVLDRITPPERGGARWKRIGAWSAAMFLAVAAAVTITEFAVGKPLGDAVQGKPGSGYTVTGGRPAPSASATAPDSSSSSQVTSSTPPPSSPATPAGSASLPPAASPPPVTSPPAAPSTAAQSPAAPASSAPAPATASP